MPKPLSSFVGRRAEIDELRRMLEGVRLLTLTGAGGCGKTRLAIELASRSRDRFSDGIALVDVAPLRAPVTVPELIAALGLSEQTATDAARVIADARLLIVIDNAEHLVEPVSVLVEELLGACANLGIVVTSRQILDIAGEVSWRVPPLRLPPAPTPEHPLDLESLATADAIRLFIARAAEHHSVFRLTADNAQLVDTICRRLDGIPLALELAAARVRSMTLQEIATRLDDSLQLLTAGPRTAVPRHRTLRAMVDWSHAMLDDPERTLLRRLGVFVGTVDLEAVEVVCAGPEMPADEMPDVLHRLIDKSLICVHARTDGGLRYGLMEVVRQYALERLAEAGEMASHDRHARYFGDLVRRLESIGVEGRGERMAAEYDNVRLALDWAEQHDPRLAIDMLHGLRWFWQTRGFVTEALRRCRALATTIASAPPDTFAPDACGRLHLNGAGWSRIGGDLEAAAAHADAAASFLDRIDDLGLATTIVHFRGVVRGVRGDAAGAEADARSALDLLDRWPPDRDPLDAKNLRSIALNALAWGALTSGRAKDALPEIQRALDLLATLPGWRASPQAPLLLHTHGAVLLALDRTADARAQLMDGLGIAVERGNYYSVVDTLCSLARIAAAEGRSELCLELAAAANACSKTTGIRRDPGPSAGRTLEAVQASRKALGERAAEEAWARGLEMDLGSALERAREAGRAAAPRAEAEPSLTPRKAEIARLVADGLYNREIARRLSISERTVQAHLDQIRTHLGLNNRAQVAAWAVAKGLHPAPETSRR